MTGLAKYEYPEERFLNETEVMHLVITALSKQEKYEYPSKDKWYLGYHKVDYILKYHKNKDYYNLPSQLSQEIIKQACKNYESYFKALKEYKKKPNKFKSKPKRPKYKKNKTITYSMTNQLCQIKYNSNKKGFLKLPKTKLKLNLGKSIKEEEQLKQVKIKIINKEIIKIYLIVEDFKEKPTKHPINNIIGIDLGIDNLCSIANNINKSALLINGKPLKSYNKHCNKKIAYYKSIAKKVNQKEITKRIEKIYNKRENYISNYIHHVSKYIINYCELNKIDTIIIGYNEDWKSNCKLGQITQTFVQIPYLKIINQLKYKAERKGINLIIQEESYTSKASFIDKDKIEKGYMFSGKRIKRGLYKSKKGVLINADINSACNIIKKHIKEEFEYKNLLKTKKVTLNV